MNTLEPFRRLPDERWREEMDALGEIRREVRRLRKEIERLLFLNGLAYGCVIAILLAQLLVRIFR
jgi:hypothetical protein